MEQSVLARYYACAAGADQEDAWIDAALTRLERDIEGSDWRQARADWERFALDVEGHFAFEELVIARTGYTSGHEHARHHGEGLAAVRALLRSVPVTPGPVESQQGIKAALLAAVREFRDHVRVHLERHDYALWRHAGRRAGLRAGRPC